MITLVIWSAYSSSTIPLITWCLNALACLQQESCWDGLARALFTPDIFSWVIFHLLTLILDKNAHFPMLYVEFSTVYTFTLGLKNAYVNIFNKCYSSFFFNTCDFSFYSRWSTKVKTKREFYDRWWTLTHPCNLFCIQLYNTMPSLVVTVLL